MAPRRHRLQMVARGPRRSRGCLGRVVSTVGRLVEAGRPCLSGECPVRAALCYVMCCDVLCCAALLSAVLCCSKRTAAFSCVSLSCTVLHSPGMLSGVCAWTGLPRPGSMLGGMVGVKVSISKTTIEYVYGGTAHPVTRQGIGLGNIERMMGTAMPNTLLPPIGLLLGAERGACLRDRDKTRERGPSNALHVV